MTHPRFLNRVADIFVHKLKNEGYDEANDWINTTFTPEYIQQLIPLIQEKRSKTKT